MLGDLDSAHDGEMWSLSGVIVGLQSLCDTQGRPLAERRAPIAIKEGVPMVMRPCPYRDEREQRSINISALSQVTAHQDALLVDIGSFHAQMREGTPTWDDFYAVIMDQLCQAAVYALRVPQPVRIPVELAVAYKVAIGYLAPARALLRLQAECNAPVVAGPALVDLVKTRRMLIGAGEVCASPPSLIARMTAALVPIGTTVRGDTGSGRVGVARTLTLQARVGIVWNLFDLAAERELLHGEVGRQGLQGRTQFLRGKLSARGQEIGAAGVDNVEQSIPEDLCGRAGAQLRAALRSHAAEALAPSGLSKLLEALLQNNTGAIESAPSVHELIAHRFVSFLRVRQVVVATLMSLEYDLRRQLGFSELVAVRLNGLDFPASRALPWFEMMLGHRLRPGPTPDAPLVLRSQEGCIPVQLPALTP